MYPRGIAPFFVCSWSPFPFYVSYIMPDPTPYTHESAVRSLFRPKSIFSCHARFIVSSLRRTLRLLSPASPLFSVLIAFGLPLRFSCKKEKQMFVILLPYIISLIGLALSYLYPLLLFSVSVLALGYHCTAPFTLKITTGTLIDLNALSFLLSFLNSPSYSYRFL